MRLLLAISLVSVFSLESLTLRRFDVAAVWSEEKFIYIKKMGSNILDATCNILSDAIRRYPINPPLINEVSFQLRSSCRRVNVPVLEAEKLHDFPEFNAFRRTVIFIGGWMSTLDESYIEEMENAYRCRGDNNFLVFNNGGFIVNEYMNSAYHTLLLGKFIAQGLQKLQILPQHVHLVGHSMGAHIAGSAGRYFFEFTSNKLGRITALDPARPCFRSPATFRRLTRTDASFTDVIHSNPYEVGTEEPIGHVDFFPGGLDVIKPGCSSKILLCSHEISMQYYTESVYPGNEQNFMAKTCSTHRDLRRKSCGGRQAPMGYAANGSLRGLYYLPVQSQWPHGVNAERNVTLKTSACGRC